MASFYEEFGARVKEARESLGLTQATLAERVRMTRSSLANVEAGRHRMLIHQVADLADALGVQIEELLPARAALLDDQLLELPAARVLEELSARWAAFTPRSSTG